MTRRMILCAYDVGDERRLAAALDGVTGWSHGGQRSVFECFAGPAETPALAGGVGTVLVPRDDRLALMQPVAGRSFTLGLGRLASDVSLLYVG